jgi:hypothetical protein
MALGAFVAIAVIAIPTFLTGEPAEEVVEHMAGITGGSIEQHEEAALIALIAVEALGVMSLIGLILLQRLKRFSQSVAVAGLAVAFVTGGLLAWTANLGGQIHHTEIRSRSVPTVISGELDDR